jgi:cation transport ATPase
VTLATLGLVVARLRAAHETIEQISAYPVDRIPEALRISRATLEVIRQNLVIALITVGALLAGVLMREVNMAGRMLVHELLVLIVILNGMRLMRA